jgi:protein dithiol oxidoreductase (disulfide-forming)
MPTILAWLIALSVATGALAAEGGAPSNFTEGIEYQRIVPPQPTETAPKVEVVEVFWYGCPHCFHFEPALEEWLKHKPDDVVFRRMPAIFTNPIWELDARAYYTAEALGVLDKIHPALFDAMHKSHRRLDTEAALAAFFAEHGVSHEEFQRTFHSFYVDTKVREARLMSQRYGIDGVPAMVVAGKYRTEASLAGSEEAMLRVVDFLVAREAAAGKAEASGAAQAAHP